jgi:polyribonucleotide nucleotidyltransferase
MFQRGDTQNIAITTLGPTKEAQEMDGLTGGAKSKSFILHYNFPPFSVGETGRFGGPGRREIGHGALAERSLVPVLPPEDFPYSIRVVSEIMASNGSTSMASICGGCSGPHGRRRADHRPRRRYLLRSHDRDGRHGAIRSGPPSPTSSVRKITSATWTSKLAGTTKGITGFQLDLKINGLPFEIAKTAIFQARDARIEILKVMLASLPAPRADLSQVRPAHPDHPDRSGEDRPPHRTRWQDHPPHHRDDRRADRHRRRRLRQGLHLLQQRRSHGRAIAEIDGLCGGGGGPAAVAAAPRSRSASSTTAASPASRTSAAFVECTPGKEGLCHISELADFRVRRTEDVVKMGEMIWVKCIGIDERSGKVRLSRKAAMKEMDAQKQGGAQPAPAAPAAQ